MRSTWMWFFVASLLVGPAIVQSQLGTGAISGTVQDATGAVVPGVQISITQTETGLAREIQSSDSGQFLAPVLPTGTYRVVATKPGFRILQQDNVLVDVGGTANLHLTLRIGDLSESVSVTTSGSLDTTQTDVSSLVDRTQIRDLPINGRRYYDFALLAPGVTRDGRFGLLSFRGASGNFANYMVEGNDDNQAYFSENRGRYRAPSTLSVDAVQEFQVGQGGFEAEFGRASGGRCCVLGATAFMAMDFITTVIRILLRVIRWHPSSLRSAVNSWVDLFPDPFAPTNCSTSSTTTSKSATSRWSSKILPAL